MPNNERFILRSSKYFWRRSSADCGDVSVVISVAVVNAQIILQAVEWRNQALNFNFNDVERICFDKIRTKIA